MDKIWFILIADEKEGPYSFFQLKRDPRITPDTLVWKEGFKDWTAIRFVPELKDIFKDENVVKEEPDLLNPVPTDLMQDQAALTIQQDPSQFILWTIVLILLIYTFYRLNS
jgi:hypothetical protein